MKLVQTKPFNAETVTQEVAARIASIVAWNHLAEPERAKLLTVADYPPCGMAATGGSVNLWTDDLAAKGYTKTPTGVEIGCPTGHAVRVLACGNALVYKKGEAGVITRAGVMNTQVELVGLYVELGFYGLSSVE